MAKSRGEYYREVLGQVLAVLRLTEDDRHLPLDTLRKSVDALPADQLLTAGIADFWLDLGPRLGRARREDTRVPSPFWPDGNKTVGKKAPIASWDQQWRELEAAKPLAGSRTQEGQDLYDMLSAEPNPWMMGFSGSQETVIGHAVWLPTVFSEEAFVSQPLDYDIRWLRPDQALRLPWVDRKEAQTWLAIVGTVHRMTEAELERVRLELDTSEAGGQTRGIPRP